MLDAEEVVRKASPVRHKVVDKRREIPRIIDRNCIMLHARGADGHARGTHRTASNCGPSFLNSFEVDKNSKLAP